MTTLGGIILLMGLTIAILLMQITALKHVIKFHLNGKYDEICKVRILSDAFDVHTWSEQQLKAWHFYDNYHQSLASLYDQTKKEIYVELDRRRNARTYRS